MSELAAQLAQFNNEPVLLAPTFTGLPGAFVAAEKEQAKGFDYQSIVAAAFGVRAFSDQKPFVFSNGIAFIPVMGVLVNRYNWIGSYVSGYNAIRALFMEAVNDDEVKGIVLDCNSHGGMVQGCFELADDVYNARSKKPILAVVDANAHSACYAIASAATKRVATRSASVGSIGVMMMHINIGGALEKMGVEVKFIYAGKHKVDGNPYQTLPKDVEKHEQEKIEAIYDEFVTLAARNLGLDAEAVRNTEAQVFRVTEAISLGLVDAVASPVEAATAFGDELSGSNVEGDNAMADDTKKGPEATTQPAAPDQQALAAEREATKTAERKRIKDITTCEEAKGREDLAAHLAHDTDMSVDAAKGILAVAPKAQAEKPADDANAGKPKAKTNAFETAMNNSDNPGVGADANNGDGDGEGDDGASPEQASARILKNYGDASGQKFH